MSGRKDYLQLPLREFLADLAARSPTPGGGSLTALAGALAAAQARMVIEYTLGKAAFAGHERQLRDSLSEAVKAQEAFEGLVAEDMAAYEKLTQAKKAKHAEDIAAALAAATDVPMKMATLAEEVARLAADIRGSVNPYLLSDLKVSAALASACVEAASMMVRANLADVTDRDDAEHIERRLDGLMAQARQHHDAVLAQPPH